MNESYSLVEKMDVLSIGLFGLAVGALTLGLIQVHVIPVHDEMAVSIICLIFGGLVQLLAGVIDIRYHEQLGGTALTMYGTFWTTIFLIKILGLTTGFHWDNILYLPIVIVYTGFSSIMIYLTAHKNLSLMILHILITLTFLADIGIKLSFPYEKYAGLGHILIGTFAFYYAIATLTNKFTQKNILPLGSPPMTLASSRLLRGRSSCNHN